MADQPYPEPWEVSKRLRALDTFVASISSACRLYEAMTQPPVTPQAALLQQAPVSPDTMHDGINPSDNPSDNPSVRAGRRIPQTPCGNKGDSAAGPCQKKTYEGDESKDSHGKGGNKGGEAI